MKHYLFYRKYYLKLQEERDIYDEVRKGIMAHKSVITFALGKNDFTSYKSFLEIVFKFVCMDNPLLFCKGCGVSKSLMDNNVQLHILYFFDRDEEERHRVAIIKRLTPIVNRLSNIKSTEKQEKEIHDVIISRVIYNKTENPWIHTVVGAVLYGYAVCDGISKTAKLLFDMLGIKSAVMFGKASDENSFFYDPKKSNHDVKNDEIGHAWNLVCVNEQWYHLDVTFDLGLGYPENKFVRYDYFNLSDRDMRADHMMFDGKIDFLCTDVDGTYYKKNGLFARNSGILSDILDKIDYNSTECFAFQISYVKNSQKAYELCNNILMNKLAGKSNGFYIIFNSAQMVFGIKIVK